MTDVNRATSATETSGENTAQNFHDTEIGAMGFLVNMVHEGYVQPNARLEPYEIGLDLQHIQNVQLKEAEAYWNNQSEKAVPDELPDGAPVWDMKHVRDVFMWGLDLVVTDKLRPYVNGDPELARQCLTTVAAQRLGIKNLGTLEGETFDEIAKNWAEAVWKEMVPRFRNPGLTNNVMNLGGGLDTKSECVHPLLLCVPGGCALEGAYGYGLNLCGMYQQIGPDDPMVLWVPDPQLSVGDLGFRFERRRGRAYADAIKSATTIVSLGAGWLPEVRHAEMIYGTMPDFTGKTLIACDSDPKIPRQMFGNWWHDSGLHVIYHQSDIASSLPILIRDHGGSVDLVYAKGVMSFMPQKLGALLGASLQLLRKGGKFKFDLQLDHPILKRDILLFSWGGMLTEGKLHLMTSTEATEFVRQTVADFCTQTGATVEWTCTSDNPSDPMGLIFTVTKC